MANDIRINEKTLKFAERYGSKDKRLPDMYIDGKLVDKIKDLKINYSIQLDKNKNKWQEDLNTEQQEKIDKLINNLKGTEMLIANNQNTSKCCPHCGTMFMLNGRELHELDREIIGHTYTCESNALVKWRKSDKDHLERLNQERESLYDEIEQLKKENAKLESQLKKLDKTKKK